MSSSTTSAGAAAGSGFSATNPLEAAGDNFIEKGICNLDSLYDAIEKNEIITSKATADDKANSVYGLDVPIGTWCVKMRVVNPQTWAKVKAGELRGFSLQGDFLDKEEYDAYMNDKKMYEDLVRLVKSL